MSKIIASTYEIIEKIGSGGGGNVFLANHLRLGKKVVLKADKRKLKTRPELLRREVDILKNLSHSYIPQVYDFFVDEEIVYTVMDFIEGESLDKALKRGEKFSQPQVIKWAMQLLEALCYLHSPTHGTPPRGFVHSDIKPANLMHTTFDNICLIDFNIALALGEENVVGCSAGYASPEHYGLDFSTNSGTATVDNEKTETLLSETETITLSSLQSSSSSKKIVVPDVRSDIYSVGATLYHLLSGRKPAKHALEVVPLSEKEFSPSLVRIILRAMNANPDLRYQTAEEMLEEFKHLHENDFRTKKLRKTNRVVYGLLSVLVLSGLISSFVGLKRIQVTEQWLNFVQYSEKSLANGNRIEAVRYALEALPQEETILTPKKIPEAVNALTEALGVYDLTDGYRFDKVVELQENPIYIKISPNGKTAACVYDNTLAIVNTEEAKVDFTLPAEDSAMLEVEYLNEKQIIYAGKEGITAYDIEQKKELWTGRRATAISIAQNGKTVAAIYKDEAYATVYDTSTGNVVYEVDFHGKSQNISMIDENFANTGGNLFELNCDGSFLAVSFQDGSLEVYDLKNTTGDIALLNPEDEYSYFEGGFYENYLAFTAQNDKKSVFAAIDLNEKVQTIGFESNSYLSTKVDKQGIYIMADNALIQIDPETGAQTSLNTTEDILYQYALSDKHIAAISQDKIMFYDRNANLITTIEKKDALDFLQIAEGIAIVGSMDSSKVKIVKYEECEEKDIFTYDSLYQHDEARVSADGKTVMLFSYKQFRLYDMAGEIIAEVSLPNPERVYNQEFIREGEESYLKVTYSDGVVMIYSAQNGELIKESQEEIPEIILDTVFYTESYRIEAPLRENPKIYKIDTNELVGEWHEDAYLIYVTQVGEVIVAQYMTTDGVCYGVLFNEECVIIGKLPYLCDVIDGELYFDCPTGSIRKSKIYDIKELTQMAKKLV